LGWFGDHTSWNSSTLVQHADEHFARAALDLVPSVDFAQTIPWSRDPWTSQDVMPVGVLTLGFKAILATCIVAVILQATRF